MNKSQIKKVKCTNNNYAKALTLLKEYPVVETIENKFLIINDFGKETTYYQGRFEELAK